MAIRNTMAKAYSDDLRRKILGAYDRKAGSLRELSERFCVSYAWARKISWQRRRTGQMERVEQRHGSPSRATPLTKFLRTLEFVGIA